MAWALWRCHAYFGALWQHLGNVFTWTDVSKVVWILEPQRPPQRRPPVGCRPGPDSGASSVIITVFERNVDGECAWLARMCVYTYILCMCVCAHKKKLEQSEDDCDPLRRVAVCAHATVVMHIARSWSVLRIVLLHLLLRLTFDSEACAVKRLWARYIHSASRCYQLAVCRLCVCAWERISPVSSEQTQVYIPPNLARLELLIGRNHVNASHAKSRSEPSVWQNAGAFLDMKDGAGPSLGLCSSLGLLPSQHCWKGIQVRVLVVSSHIGVGQEGMSWQHAAKPSSHS